MKGGLRAKLDEGQICYGMGIRISKSVEIVRLARDCGYDWLFFDHEHGPHSWDAISQLCLASIEADISPFVRIKSHLPEEINKALSIGAVGIIVPQIENKEVVKKLSDCCRFFPEGTRTSPGKYLQLGYNPIKFSKASKVLNHETLFFAQIESEIGVENVELILENPNVDGIMIGVNDLTFSMGIPQEYGHRKLEKALDSMLKYAQKYNKSFGVGGLSNPKLLKSLVNNGANLILVGLDTGFIFDGALNNLKNLKNYSTS